LRAGLQQQDPHNKVTYFQSPLLSPIQTYSKIIQETINHPSSPAGMPAAETQTTHHQPGQPLAEPSHQQPNAKLPPAVGGGGAAVGFHESQPPEPVPQQDIGIVRASFFPGACP